MLDHPKVELSNMIINKLLPSALQRSSIGSVQRIRGISLTVPVFSSIKDFQEEITDLRSEFVKQEVVSQPVLDEEKYRKDVERYVKNRRKAGTIIAEEKSGSLSAWKQGGIIPDKDISGSDSSSSYKLSTIKLNQSVGSGSVSDGNAVRPPSLEHITGWGTSWQQGGSGSLRNSNYFIPRYSQGMGDRERYIGHLKTNDLQYFPNRSQGKDGKKPLPDHTRSWSKLSRLVMTKPIALKNEDFHETGFLDSNGNDRGRIQRWPSTKRS